MYKTHSNTDNSQVFELKINDQKIKNIIIYFEHEEQIPRLNLPDHNLILIGQKGLTMDEGSIQTNFFSKSIVYVSEQTIIDTLKHQKVQQAEDKLKFSRQVLNSTLKYENKGILNCVHGAALALEMDLVEAGKEVIVISGVEKALDTMVIVTPSTLAKVQMSKIKEVLCEPEVLMD